MSKDLFLMLQRGYFPKELPPAFNTYTFALASNKLKNSIQRGWGDVYATPCVCSIPKNGIGRRYVHVLHPLPYFFLARFVTENYADIKNICGKTPISYSTPIKSQSLKQRYLIPKSKNVASFQEARHRKGMDKYVELKVDISNFYPSIYTHIIPWAFVGKRTAKDIWRCKQQNRPNMFPQSIKELYNKGNQIDILIEKCQGKQTHGIPVGTDISYLIAEAVLSYIDDIILQKSSIITGCRYYDDYYLYFDTTEEAEKILKIIIDELNDWGLEINLSKVEINKLPVPIMERYAIKLSPFDFTSKWKGQMLQVYFDMLWSLVKERPAKVDTILRYGLNILSRNLPTLTNKEANSLYILLFKTAILSPSVTPEILDVVSKMNYAPDPVILKRMTDAVMRKHLQLEHHLELLWAIWMCKRYRLDIAVETVVDIFKLNNPLCTLMLLDYLNNVKPAIKADAMVGNEINNLSLSLKADALYDERWILLYEGAIKGWLPLMHIVQGDSFFAFLEQEKVSFYDVNVHANYMSASYIFNMPFSVPDFVKNKTKRQTERLLNRIRARAIQEKEAAMTHFPFDIIDKELDNTAKVDEAIEENDVKNTLFEELLYPILAGEEFDEQKIIDNYVTLLVELENYQ